MTLPHQCRCAICGEVGVIVPALPNVFGAPLPALPYSPVNPITTGGTTGLQLSESGAMLAATTCLHGYRICAICKFPPIPQSRENNG